MALINCPECSSEVSDQSDSCPKCGFPIKSKKREEDLKKLLAERKADAVTKIKANKKFVFPVIHLIALILISLIYFELPYPRVNNQSPYNVYNDREPTGCDSELALRKDINDYQPWDDIENTNYAFHAESFVYSGSSEQSQAIKCEIWRDYQRIGILSFDEQKAKYATLIAVILDPLISIPLFICWFICFFNKTISKLYGVVGCISVSLVVGFISEALLSDSQFYRPNELKIIHAFSVMGIASLISMIIHVKKYNKSIQATANVSSD